MPKMLKFGTDPDRFAEDSHLNLVNWKGQVVPVRRGDMLPLAEVSSPDPQDLVALGFAEIVGDDDGGGGSAYLIRAAIAKIVAQYRLLPDGNEGTWTLEEMIEAIRSVKATDDAAILAFAEAKKAPAKGKVKDVQPFATAPVDTPKVAAAPAAITPK